MKMNQANDEQPVVIAKSIPADTLDDKNSGHPVYLPLASGLQGKALSSVANRSASAINDSVMTLTKTQPKSGEPAEDIPQVLR